VRENHLLCVTSGQLN